MVEEESSPPSPLPPKPIATGDDSPAPPPTLRFDPSRMIGIIRRKALIKELAAAYHAECLQHCQELLELQRKWEEQYLDIRASEELKKESRPPKRLKKGR